MFTGIIETTGRIEKVEQKGTNKLFWVKSSLASELKIDQSLSHNGVCLTIDELADGLHRVTAIRETLQKSSLGNWQEGDSINLERCVPLNGRLDGHLVQGHVDTRGKLLAVSNNNGSWNYRFSFPPDFSHLVIEKGSISLDGISLTIFDLTRTEFTVSIIPYTYEHTNLRWLSPGDEVNLEFDMVGKYVSRLHGR